MRKVSVTFLVPDNMEAELEDDKIALLLRDAIYEFSHRSGAQVTARVNARAYVEQRYGGLNTGFSLAMLESKVRDTVARNAIAAALGHASIQVEIGEASFTEPPPPPSVRGSS
jgi:hypothetical protein